jgi:serine/threonine protein kinase
MDQQVVGTVAYIAPEQIQGKSHPASDQYALGVVVYEWLCGDPPFHGSATEVALQHTLAPPAPLHDRLPSLLPQVEQVVMKALAKDPHQRFPRVQDFVLALKQASQSQTSFFSDPTIARAPLPPISAPSPSQPPTTLRKRKAGLIIVLLLALLALLGGVGAWLGVSHSHPPSQQPLVYPQVAGTYKGIVVDTTSNNTPAEMSLSLQQNQGNISGQFILGSQLQGNGLLSNGLLTGTVDTANHVQFTVQSAEGNAPLSFDGSVQSDGSLVGTYCSLGTNAQCSAQAGASGTWKVSKKETHAFI